MGADDIFKEWDKLKKQEKQNITPTKKLLLEFLKRKGVPEEEFLKALESELKHHDNPANLGQVISRRDAEKIIGTIMGKERQGEKDIEEREREYEEKLREEVQQDEKILRREAERGVEREAEVASRGISQEEEIADEKISEEKQEEERFHHKLAKHSKRLSKKAAKAGMKGMKTAANFGLKSARNTYKSRKSQNNLGFLDPRYNFSGTENKGSGTMALLVFLAAVVHIVDGWWTGFNSGLVGQGLILTLLRAFFYGIFALVVSSQVQNRRAVFGVAALEVLTPFLIGVLIAADLGLFSLFGRPDAFLIIFWTFTPLFALYLSYEGKGRLLAGYGLGVVVLVFASLLSSPFVNTAIGGQAGPLALSQSLSSTQLDVRGSFEQAADYFGEAFSTAVERVGGAWTRSVDYATGGYYTSMVEDQQGEEVGLRIENERFTQDYYFEGDPVYLWADMLGRSFKDPIRVYPSCRVRDGPVGEVEPESFEVFYRGGESIQCRVDDLEEGSHTVILEAGFNFDTWAYVTYTFVEQQTMRNYFAQDKDVNRELDIDRSLRPRHTPGPMAIGMSSEVPQPIAVREEDEEAVVNTVFGVTLDDHWTDGELDRVRRFAILVPSEFELRGCDADHDPPGEDSFCEEEPDLCARDMDAYTFQNVGTPKKFDTVTCRLAAKEGVSAEDIIPPGQQKAQKTFVVKAEYDYILRETERTEVRSIGGQD